MDSLPWVWGHKILIAESFPFCVLRQRSQELRYYSPTKLDFTGVTAAPHGYGSYFDSSLSGGLNESRIRFSRSRTLASRQQSPKATIFASSSDSGCPASRKRSPR